MSSQKPHTNKPSRSRPRPEHKSKSRSRPRPPPEPALKFRNYPRLRALIASTNWQLQATTRLLARSSYLLKRLISVQAVFERGEIPAHQPPKELLTEVYYEINLLMDLLENTKKAAMETHRELALLHLEGRLSFLKEIPFAMAPVRGGHGLHAKVREADCEEEKIAIRDAMWFLERVQIGGKRVGEETMEVREIMTEVAGCVSALEFEVVVLPNENETWEWWRERRGQVDDGAIGLPYWGQQSQEEWEQQSQEELGQQSQEELGQQSQDEVHVAMEPLEVEGSSW
jgi:hypothetical protein